MKSNFNKIDEYSMPKENIDFGKEFDIGKEQISRIEELQYGRDNRLYCSI